MPRPVCFDKEIAIPDPFEKVNIWKNTPRWTVAVFLVAVFVIFSIIGFSVDVANLGKQSESHLALSVLITGGFAV